MKRLLTILLLVLSKEIYAQCAMCKATLENQEEGSTIGGSINDGILYLMPIPYILIAIIAGVFYYKYKKSKKSTIIE